MFFIPTSCLGIWFNVQRFTHGFNKVLGAYKNRLIRECCELVWGSKSDRGFLFLERFNPYWNSCSFTLELFIPLQSRSKVLDRRFLCSLLSEPLILKCQGLNLISSLWKATELWVNNGKMESNSNDVFCPVGRFLLGRINNDIIQM